VRSSNHLRTNSGSLAKFTAIRPRLVLGEQLGALEEEGGVQNKTGGEDRYPEKDGAAKVFFTRHAGPLLAKAQSSPIFRPNSDS
jgi:hypothetical protein